MHTYTHTLTHAHTHARAHTHTHKHTLRHTKDMPALYPVGARDKHLRYVSLLEAGYAYTLL